MKKIITAVAIFVFSFTANYCFGEIQPESNTDSGVDPVLERELNNIGISSTVFTRDTSDFRDGDFKLSEKIAKAIMSDNLFRSDPEIQKNLKQTISDNKTLLFPWSNTGIARLARDNDNLVAELYQVSNEDTSISQSITFKSANASIKFDLTPVKTNSDDKLEVLISTFDASGQPQEIILASYQLSDFSGNKHIEVDLYGNKKFAENLRELKNSAGGYESMVDVVFRLQGNKNKDNPTIIHLGNFKISYIY
ncbi:MAG: hypothetical protein WC412_01870 [Candidatus Omnitrophota bacterium]|jgi:hypothetical protein